MGGRKQKAGEKGPAAQYMTRSKALKKLQLSLAAFRRLCILKNIFPRDPPTKLKKKSGGDKVYYHVKDVTALQHEPLLRVFRQLRATKKKINKALGRREKAKAKRLLKSRPPLQLQRIVKERFPTLKDAVADMDDALCTISIYAVLPAYRQQGVKPRQVLQAAQLLDQFLLLAAHQRALRCVFASIKGYYFRLQLLGQDVVFLLPHFFLQTIPETVDMKVLSTFYSLYSTTLKFVIFKFYLMAGLAYPPSPAGGARVRGSEKRSSSVAKATAAGASSAAAAATLAGEKRRDSWGEMCWRFPVLRVRRIAAEEEEKKKSEEEGRQASSNSQIPAAAAAETSAAVGEQQAAESERSDEGRANSSHAALRKEDGQVKKCGKNVSAATATARSGAARDEDTAAGTAEKDQQQMHRESEPEKADIAAAEVGKRKERTTTASLSKKKAKSKTSFLWNDEVSPCGVAPHPVQRLFEGYVFFLNREVPLLPFCFIIRSCGGTVGWQGSGSPFGPRDRRITHHIVDRPLAHLQELLQEEVMKEREVVQPQWILDSVNAAVLLPVHAYAPGKVLPPHLSPFLDDYKEGYVPQQRRILDCIIAEKRRTGAAAVAAPADGNSTKEEDSDAEDISSTGGGGRAEKKFQQQLEAEAAGALLAGEADAEEGEDSTSADEKVEEQQQKSKRIAKENAATLSADTSLLDEEQQQQLKRQNKKRPLQHGEDELLQAKKSLLRKKHRRLLERIQHGAREKEKRAARLLAKHQALEMQKQQQQQPDEQEHQQ